jgi:hypothetical protein
LAVFTKQKTWEIPFWIVLQNKNRNFVTNHGDTKLKGSVARDFLPLVFSMNWPHIVPEFTPWNIFEFFFEFGEIFVF